jgi:hypothetical protein
MGTRVIPIAPALHLLAQQAGSQVSIVHTENDAPQHRFGCDVSAQSVRRLPRLGSAAPQHTATPAGIPRPARQKPGSLVKSTTSHSFTDSLTGSVIQALSSSAYNRSPRLTRRPTTGRRIDIDAR